MNEGDDRKLVVVLLHVFIYIHSKPSEIALGNPRRNEFILLNSYMERRFMFLVSLSLPYLV